MSTVRIGDMLIYEVEVDDDKPILRLTSKALRSIHFSNREDPKQYVTLPSILADGKRFINCLYLGSDTWNAGELIFQYERSESII